MRLSDIKGDRVFDVIADIIDPIANIASDETASALFKREKLPDGMTAKAFLLERARKAVDLVCQHKQEKKKQNRLSHPKYNSVHRCKTMPQFDKIIPFN